MKPRPAKEADVHSKTLKLIESGEHAFTGHAKMRLDSREVSALEVFSVLKKGRRVPKRDRFNECDDYGNKINRWSYAYEGKTLDKRNLRIVISFLDIPVMMLIITVVDLDQKV